MTKLPLTFIFLLAVLPLLNAQFRGLQQQSQISTCLAAFKDSQASVNSLLSILESQDQNEIVKSLTTMSPQIQELASKCNLRPIPAIRVISNPNNCVTELQHIKGLAERLKGIDLNNPSISNYVILISAYGALIQNLPRLANDCTPSNGN